MLHLMAAVGPSPAELIAPLMTGDDETRNGGPLVVARARGPRPPVADCGAFFSTPDGRCDGVLVGQVFNRLGFIGDGAADLPAPERLGHALMARFEREGPRALDALDGGWAAVFRVDDEVWVGRDAIGERPVYVMSLPDGWLLSDRMAPLLSHPACERQIDPGGVADYFAAGFCLFDRTPIRGISKIPPGSVRRLWPNPSDANLHHRLPDAPPGSGDPVAQLRARLDAAIDKRWVRGEKTGLLLSGGLDSSLVGGLAGGERFEAAYSLAFGSKHRNELEFSGLMAQRLGLEHRVVHVTPRDVVDHLEPTMAILDEPIGDALTVPNVLVARAAARDVRVIFNGEGGDPIFGGPKNLPLMAAAAFDPDPQWPELYLRSYNKGYQHLPQVLSADFRGALAEVAAPADLLSPWFGERARGTLLDTLLHINLRLKGAGQILPKVFKAAATVGLTVQSPLFDRHVAELAFGLPPGLKLNGTREKHLLKEAVRDVVPEVILERPKSGMLVPVHPWFKNELRGFARDVLLGPNARIRPLVDDRALRRLLAFKDGGVRGYHGQRIWLLASLEMWMRAHGV